MLKNFLIASATALLISAGAQTASAYAPMPEVTAKAPVTAPVADGSYKVAHRTGRRHSHRSNRNVGRNVGIGVAAGIIGLGLAAAAADASRHDRGSCRRVERRCADRHGWETRRWYHCVEDFGC